MSKNSGCTAAQADFETAFETTLQAVPRPVEVLIGIRSVAAFLKVSVDKVRDMEAAGAPFIRDAKGVLRAEKAELWLWWKHSSGKR